MTFPLEDYSSLIKPLFRLGTSENGNRQKSFTSNPSLRLSPLRLSEDFVQQVFQGIGNFVSIGEEEVINWRTNTSLKNVIRQNLSN